VDFRQFRTFVAAAEEQHFARAAERLGIAQPAVTQQIKALESALGYRLFRRAGRGIVLSDAGQAFLHHARQALASADMAAIVGRRASRGELGRLCIAYTHSTMQEAELPSLLRRFTQAFPDIDLELHALTVQEQLAALEDERIDVAFLRTPLGEVSNTIRLTAFSHTVLDVVLPAGHRLAAARRIDLRDLAGDRLVMVNDPPGVGLGQHVLQLCADAGVHPSALLRAPDAVTVLALVSAGLGVGLVPSTLSRFGGAGAIFRPLTAANKFSEVVIATRLLDRSATVIQLLALARQVAAPRSAVPR